MIRAKELGLEDYHLALSDRIRQVREEESVLNRWDRADLIRSSRQSLVETLSAAAIAHYLAGKDAKARSFAERVVPSAAEYYFGDWRNRIPSGTRSDAPPNSEWWHDKEPWMHTFRAALCWGSVLKDWTGLKLLARYPDDKRMVDGGAEKPAMKSVLVDVAKFLSGGLVRGVAERCSALVGFDWRGTAHFAHGMDAIVSGNSRAAQNSIDSFFEAWHKRKTSNDLTDTVSYDGTFMVNLAAHAGLKIKVGAVHQLYYVRLSVGE